MRQARLAGRRVFVRTPLTSGYAEFAAAREIAVGALPDDIPFERGAILQTLPPAVHATRGVRLGDRVAIVGQGPIGLMALQVARLRGAAEIAVADLDPWRLERSALLGADRTVAVDASAGPDALLAGPAATSTWPSRRSAPRTPSRPAWTWSGRTGWWCSSAPTTSTRT